MNSITYNLSIPIAMLFAVGCSDATKTSAGISVESAALATFNAAGAPTVAFTVPDMMCPEGCAVTVKELLAQQPGVKDVVVDFDAKTAMVAVDPDQFDAEAAIATLVDRGFDHSTLRSNAATAEKADR